MKIKYDRSLIEQALKERISRLQNVRIKNLEERFKKLEESRKKPNYRKLVTKVLEEFWFPKKQGKLLMALSSFKPVKSKELNKKTGSKNLKDLVQDTGKTIKKHDGARLEIIPLRGKPFPGYKLKIRPLPQKQDNQNRA